MKIKTGGTRMYILGIGIALAITVLAAGTLHEVGYVISDFKIVKSGTLIIENARPFSNVFIDNKRIGQIDETGTTEFTGIKPGARTVLIGNATVWPWVLDFTILPDTTVSLTPLQVNQESDGAVLRDASDPIRQRAITEFKNYREPTRMQPLEREGVRVWVEGVTIFVQKNDEVRQVFTSSNPLREVSWYGDRSDAIIVASLNNVFALDIRKSSVQNFLPIYTGSAPEAVSDPIRSSKIFVKDADQYFEVSI